MGSRMKKTKNAAARMPEQRVDENPQLKCPFCGKEFTAKELIFAVRTDKTDVLPDEVYQKFLDDNFLPTGKDSQRRMKFFHGWSHADVESWDVKDVIPLTVKGVFEAPARPASTMASVLSSADMGLEDSYFVSDSPAAMPAPAAAPASQSPKEEPVVSAYRLCPHCHCELPQGLGIYKEIVVGLYGGPRSGKTTYMTIVTESLLNQLGSLGLGTSRLMAESRDVHRSLYEETCKAKGNDPTLVGKRPFPIGLTIEPTNTQFPPFFLIFQDIPGEAATASSDELVDHPFTRADAFLGILDVNMFIRTTDSERLRECNNQIADLTKKLTDLEKKLNASLPPDEVQALEKQVQAFSEQTEQEQLSLSKCARYMRNPRSMQLMRTKVDHWQNEGTVADEQIANLNKQLTALEQKLNAALPPEALEMLLKNGQEYHNQLTVEQAEHARLTLSICTKSLHDIFGDPKCAHYMRHLRSMQLILTKMDRWRDEGTVSEDKKELAYCTELNGNHIQCHKHAINDLHLRYVDKQVRGLLTLFPEANVAASFNDTCLEQLAKLMPKEAEIKDLAFTAVTSKLELSNETAGSEFTYNDSENILDPIFNICKWENLLPVKKS